MTSDRPSAIQRFYPEVNAGGYSRVDSTTEFYFRVNVLVKPAMTVVDLGAGRGAAHADETTDFKTTLRNFRCRCKKVIGIDVDPAVLENTSLDEALLIHADGTIPLDDNSIDLIFSDFTFEHVADPEKFSTEVLRILKPGGWLCARTPNKWGYIALGARLVPNTSHSRFLYWLQPARKERDVFPTVYKLNSYPAFAKYFPDMSWDRYVYTWNPEPAYFADSHVGWALMIALFKVLPQRFGTVFMFYAQKRKR